MPEREECAEKLSSALEQASASAKEAILETLKEMGGRKSLETMAKMAKSEDPQMQDSATRILGEWMSSDAGPVLLDLAKDPKCRYRVRALRAYIRLPRTTLHAWPTSLTRLTRPIAANVPRSRKRRQAFKPRPTSSSPRVCFGVNYR